MSKLLEQAISNNQAKEYYGAYLIYPRRFMNSSVLDALLAEVKDEYELYNIMGTIKAMRKN